MKKYSYLLFLPALAMMGSCVQGNNKDNSSGKMTYGSPEAVVTQAPDTASTPVGPLAYGSDVPQLSDKDTVDIKFDVTHEMVQVTRGVSFMAWPFGGSIPGPTVKVRVGQVVRFSMTNRSNEVMKNISMHAQGQSLDASGGHAAHDMSNPAAQMPHSIDFHAAMVNPEDKYRSIFPGETIHFTWTANYPGVFMYHCGTPMVLTHMIHGMFGMVIVEPEGGFPGKVDKEFVLVQNEFYLKKVGDHYVADTASAMLKQPMYVAFNGHPAQYVVKPLKAKAGDRVRFYILNAGPNNATAFHVIGTILDQVWLDGNPKNELNGLQSVYIGPASGAIVEFVLPEKGAYTFLDHSFADAERGAQGIIKAE